MSSKVVAVAVYGMGPSPVDGGQGILKSAVVVPDRVSTIVW
jgi:hypothetical protein